MAVLSYLWQIYQNANQYWLHKMFWLDEGQVLSIYQALLVDSNDFVTDLE